MDTNVLVSLVLAASLLALAIVYRLPNILEALAKNQVLRNRRKLMTHQQTVGKMTEVEYLRLTIENSQAEIQRLTNLLLSKNPETFSAIQTASYPDSSEANSYVPSGTDINEYNMWAAATGQPLVKEPYGNDVLTDGVLP